MNILLAIITAILGAIIVGGLVCSVVYDLRVWLNCFKGGYK